MTTLSDTIKFARLSAGLTLREVSERTGLHLQTIYRYESGGIKPKLAALAKLAEALGLSMRKLTTLSLED